MRCSHSGGRLILSRTFRTSAGEQTVVATVPYRRVQINRLHKRWMIYLQRLTKPWSGSRCYPQNIWFSTIQPWRSHRTRVETRSSGLHGTRLVRHHGQTRTSLLHEPSTLSGQRQEITKTNNLSNVPWEQIDHLKMSSVKVRGKKADEYERCYGERCPVVGEM